MKGDTEVLLAAMASGSGVAAAARAAGMHRSTAYRRLRDPDIAERLAVVQSERRASLMAWSLAVSAAADLVLDATVDLLDDDPDPATVVRLAGLLLPEVRHLGIAVDLSERVALVEAALTGVQS